jgi:hypothetical protein
VKKISSAPTRTSRVEPGYNPVVVPRLTIDAPITTQNFQIGATGPRSEEERR